MLSFRNRAALLTALIAAAGTVIITAQLTAQQPRGPFTAEQASAGRTVYQENCASCHLPDLAGRNEAPQLGGSNFMSTWGSRTTHDLFTLIQLTMPPGNAGGLSDQSYVDIVAFILQANGAAAGTQPLTGAGTTVISSVATGQMPANLGRRRTGCRPVAGDKLRLVAAVHRRIDRLTVTGEVKNYVPGDGSDAHASRSRGLADDPAQLSGLELQSAHSDHHWKRVGPPVGLGMGDE